MIPIAEKPNYGKHLARGAGITFVGLIIIGISQFLLRIILAQGLTKSEFGLFFAVFTLLSFINVFSHLGLNQAVTRFVSKYRAEENFGLVKSSIFSPLVLITIISLIIISIIIGLSGFLASTYFESPKATPVIIILSIWFFVMSFHNFFASTLRGFKNFFGRTLADLFRNLTPFIGVVIFAYFFDLKLTSASFFYLLGAVASVSLMLIFLKRRHLKKIPTDSNVLSKKILNKMLIFGFPLILSGIATSVIGRTDTIMLTGLRSLGDVGLYEVARLTKLVLINVGTALAMPLFPIVSELWTKGKKKELRSTLKLITKFSFVLLIPSSLLFMAFPRIIIRILFGSEYIAATNPMRILAFFSIFWTISRTFEMSLGGIGKTTLVLKSTGSAAVANVFLNLLLIPLYGATGAALATGLSFLISFLLCFYYSKREIDFPMPIESLIKTGAGGILTLLLIYILKGVLTLPTLPLLFAVLVPTIFFYGFWLLKAKIIKNNDLEIITNTTPIPRKIIQVLKKLAQD